MTDVDPDDLDLLLKCRGGHPFGAHVFFIIRAGQELQPNSTPERALNVWAAVRDALDALGGTAQASQPRAAAPDKAPVSGRTRATTNNPERAKAKVLPMNPGSGHHASAGSQAPPSDLDSNYWQREVTRVTDHHDRCEAIRRAASYLATLIRPDTSQPRAVFTIDDRKQQVLDDGLGWSLTDIARHVHESERFCALARIDKGYHPLTGKQWTPPTDNAIAAHQARAMRDQGMTSTDIGTALGRSPSAVRMWITHARRAA